MERESREELIRRLSAEYLVLRNLIQELRRRVEILNRLLIEIDDTLSSLESVKELKEEDSVLFSIGSMSYVRGKIIDRDKVLVNVGADVVIEKSIDDAMEYLRDKQKSIQLELRTTVAQLQQASTRLSELEGLLEREARERE